MPTAILTAEPNGRPGPARTFRVDPALRDPTTGRDYGHVTIYIPVHGGPRIEVVGSDSEGHPFSMQPVPGSQILQHPVSLDDACVWALLTAGGYEIVEPEPERKSEDDEPEEAE